jgi:hypothetical protein
LFSLYLVVLYLTLYDQVLSAWLVDQAPLGHKRPRPGHNRQQWCPVCLVADNVMVKLSCVHLLTECPAVRPTRVALGIESFFVAARLVGRGLSAS